MTTTRIRVSGPNVPPPVPELFSQTPRKAVSTERDRIKKRLEALDLPLWWRLWLKGVEHDPWVRDSEPGMIGLVTAVLGVAWTLAIVHWNTGVGSGLRLILCVLGVLMFIPIAMDKMVLVRRMTWQRIAWRWFLAAAMPLWLIAVLVAPKLREYGAEKFDNRSTAELEEAEALRRRASLGPSELLRELYLESLDTLRDHYLGPESRFARVKALLISRFNSPVGAGMWRDDPSVRGDGILGDLNSHEQVATGILTERARAVRSLAADVYAHSGEQEAHLSLFRNELTYALVDVEALLGESSLEGVLKSAGFHTPTPLFDESLVYSDLLGLAARGDKF